MEENNEINSATSPLSASLSTLLSNPEIMEKLSAVLSSLGAGGTVAPPPPQDNNNIKNTTNTATSEENSADLSDNIPTNSAGDISALMSKIPSVLSLLSENKEGGTMLDHNQKALLSALRPYLSEKRRELIDLFIKMDRFGSIFKTIAKE